MINQIYLRYLNVFILRIFVHISIDGSSIQTSITYCLLNNDNKHLSIRRIKFFSLIINKNLLDKNPFLSFSFANIFPMTYPIPYKLGHIIILFHHHLFLYQKRNSSINM